MQSHFHGIDSDVLARFSAPWRPEAGTALLNTAITYHRYSNCVALSSGVKYVADNGGENGAYWLIDAIANQICAAARRCSTCQVKQVWELKVAPDRSAVLACLGDRGISTLWEKDDPSLKQVVVQKIPYTDFDLTNIKLYVYSIRVKELGIRWIISLESEY